MVQFPKLIVVGGARCGTTSLYEYFKKHPSYYVPFIKETNFFYSDYSKGLAYYTSEYFSELNANQVGVDLSPKYLYSKSVTERLHESLPNAKILIIVRDPVDRAWSEYVSAIRLGNEKRSFLDAVKDELQEYKGGTTSQWMVERGYYYRSIFSTHIDRFISVYGTNSVFLLNFNDLVKQDEKCFWFISRFSGAEHVEGLELGRVNSSFVKEKIPILEKMLWGEGFLFNLCRSVAKFMTPRKLRPFIVDKVRAFNLSSADVKVMSESDKAYLTEVFKDEYIKLQKLGIVFDKNIYE